MEFRLINELSLNAYLYSMFRQLVGFLLLIIHINGSMVFPQVMERDVYASGKPIDDINTLAEYIQQQLLDVQDQTPEDEDNDQPKDVKPVHAGYEYCEAGRSVQIVASQPITQHAYLLPTEESVFEISFDILTPPPRNLA